MSQLFMDAALYVKEQENQFDVIIVDSSDPVGKRGSKMIGRSRGESVHGVILQHDAKCVA